MADRPGARIPAHAICASQSSVLRAINRLVDVESREPGLLSLTSSRISNNAIQLLCERSRTVSHILALIFGVGGVAYGAYTKVWKNEICRQIIDAALNRFRASITITSGNPLNKLVLLHLVKNGLGKDARTLTAVTPEEVLRQREMQMLYFDHDPRAKKPKKHEEAVSEPDPVDYVPSVGSYTFFHNGYRMKMTRTASKYVSTHGPQAVPAPTDPAAPQHLTITCYSLTGVGVQPIKDFMRQVTIEANCEKKGNKTTVFKIKIGESGHPRWDDGVSRPARTLDSVALEKQKKDSLIKEITRYLSAEEERWYATLGIPYRRGLLFYGPPGTGKTSFAVALSGHYKLNLYIISMSNRALSDQDLENLFELLPHRCVVLMEDIDSSGIQREAPVAAPKQKTKRPGPPGFPPSQHRTPPSRTGVTLAGLLNVLDGPASKDGRLVCMTSNNPDVLDAALLRPGRIDSKILFDYASHEVSTLLFTRIFTRTAEQVAADTAQQASHDIPALAEQFASQIPASKITPAEVQGYLLRNRDDALAAVKGAAAFAQSVIDAKDRGANVAAFANEIAGPAVLEANPTPPTSDRAVAPRVASPLFTESSLSEDSDDGDVLSISSVMGGAMRG